MEKEHNRGQDGAGIATIKIDLAPGYKFLDRRRSISPTAIKDIFEDIFKKTRKIQKKNPELYNNTEWMKKNVPFTGEVLMDICVTELMEEMISIVATHLFAKITG